MIEMMIVLALIGALAALAYSTTRSATRNANVGSAAQQVAMQLAGVRLKALAEQRDYVMVLSNAASNGRDCAWNNLVNCTRLFSLTNIPTSWNVSTFDPAHPTATGAALDNSWVLPRGIHFQTLTSTAYPPFNSVPALDISMLGTCVGGQLCLAVRFNGRGVATPELRSGFSAQPKLGVMVGLSSDAVDAATTPPGVLLAFPSGLVKTFAAY
jgi:type II secretory pathway pseudopilin PulG